MMTNDVVMKISVSDFVQTLWTWYLGYKERWAINDIEKVKEIYIQTEKTAHTHIHTVHSVAQ